MPPEMRSLWMQYAHDTSFLKCSQDHRDGGQSVLAAAAPLISEEIDNAF